MSDFGAAIRDRWALDPFLAHLNHGGYGAAPRPVLEAQSALRDLVERDPTAFYVHDIDERMGVTRRALAEFLRADRAGLAFVTNATIGMQTAIASLAPRDVVCTDHVYLGVRRQLERSGARVTEVPVDLDPQAGPVLDALTETTDLVVVDAIASPSAALFPVAEIVRGAHEHGVPVLVDAAHAPGLLDVDLRELGADYWVGNLHKWLCAPKAAAVLYVAEPFRERTRPLVTGNSAGLGFLAEFDWQGVVDLTALHTAPAAVEFLGGLGWERIRAYSSELARAGAEVVAAALGTSFHASPGCPMAIVDPGRDLTYQQALALRDELFTDHGIEVATTWWRNRAWFRLSAYVYNELGDYERLATAVRVLGLGR